MLDTEDIKKLTDYQIEVFKDVFATKGDIKLLEGRFDQMQTTLGSLVKDKNTKDQEMASANHRLDNAENWIEQAAPKVGVKFRE